MQIDWSAGHVEKERLPIIERREPGSNVKFESFSQPAKQFSEIVSTDDGMQIDSSDAHGENTDASIIEILLPDSNVKSERFVQFSKQDAQILRTDEGIQIDCSAEQDDKAALPRIES
jgi:hypothetical protein